MFYSQVILARKGPLGKIWMAAHFDKKLTKTQIFSTDITDSVDSVLNPPQPLALRVSGHLMLGIVRIYSRKVKYLMNDCTEAMWKIKLAFRPGNVDLGPDAAIASLASIDDARYFGNVQPDFEYPELADTAFDPDFLSGYATIQAARGRTLATTYETTDYDTLAAARASTSSMRGGSMGMGGLSPLGMRASIDTSRQPDETEEQWQHRRSESMLGLSSMGRVSDVEMVRAGDRSSLSAGRRSVMSFVDDDNVPAFDESMAEGGADMSYDYGEAPPADYDYEYAAPDLGDDGRPSDASAFPLDRSRLSESQTRFASLLREGGEGDEGSLPRAVSPEGVPAGAAPKRQAKRQRLLVDEVTELTAQEMKAHQDDMSGIQSRAPGAPLPRAVSPDDMLTGDQRIHMPSIRGLCPELQGLFDMSMGLAPLPFPIRPLAARAASTSSVGGGVDDVEMTRGLAPDATADARRISEVSALDKPRTSFGGDDGAEWEEPAGGNDDYYNNDSYDADLGLDVQAEPDYSAEPLPDSEVQGALEGAGRRSISFAGDAAEAADKLTGSEMSTWNSRTARVFEILKDTFRDAPDESCSFKTISHGVTRRTAATCFLEILQLKTWGILTLEQEGPYEDMQIRPTHKMWTLE